MAIDILNRKHPHHGYGITESKKAELDALALQVLTAQHEVEQLNAIKTSLLAKSSKFAGFLQTANENRAQALSNLNLVNDVKSQAFELLNLSKKAFDKMAVAEKKTKKVAKQINKVVNELIYSAEVVGKLGNMIIRKKAINPLISEELVSLVAKAGTDANNAVALTLNALKSMFDAQASNGESEAASVLEYTQADKLYSALVEDDETAQKFGLCTLLSKAYDSTKSDYDKAQIANSDALAELNSAILEYNEANTYLESLEAGYAAASAAALAS